MKKLLFILLLVLPLEVWGQTAPSGYTTNFNFRKWAQGANPGADSLNANWNDVDTYIFSGKRGAIWPNANNTYDLGAASLYWDSTFTRYLTLSSLTASRLVATDANKGLVSTITAANLLSSVSGTTGTAGNLVFSASPTFTGTVNGAALNFTGAGTFGGVISASGLTLSGLTASRLVASDGSKNLVSTITAANLASSVTGTTGSGNLVFATSPDFATSLSMGGTSFMDASRNLSNIGTISSGAITSSGTVEARERVFIKQTDLAHTWNFRAFTSGILFLSREDATNIWFIDQTGSTTQSGSLTVAGAGTFGGDVAVNGGDLTSTATTFNLLNSTVTTLNLGGAVSTLNIGAAGGTLNSSLHLKPTLTDAYDLGASDKLWRSSWISEMNAIVFAENTISLLGGWFYVTKGQGTVTEDVDNSETAIDFDATGSLAQNDIVVFRNNGQVEYMKIGTNVSGNTWNVTRNVDGSGANTWPSGTPYANFGQAGNGRVELNANETPRISIVQQGTGYNNQTEVVRLGDLNGNWGYSAQTWGMGLGKYASGYNSLTVDTANGVRFFNGTGVVGQLSTSTWTLGSTSTEHLNLTSTSVQIKDGSSVYTDLTAGVLTLGLSSGGEYMTLDGTNGIKMYGGGKENLSLSNAGVVTIGEVGASKSNIQITSGELKLRNNTTDIITLSAAGKATFNSSQDAQRIVIQGDSLQMFVNNHAKFTLGKYSNSVFVAKIDSGIIDVTKYGSSNGNFAGAVDITGGTTTKTGTHWTGSPTGDFGLAISASNSYNGIGAYISATGNDTLGIGVYAFGQASGGISAVDTAIGIFAKADASPNGKAYAGYFGDGDVKVENNLELDGSITVADSSHFASELSLGDTLHITTGAVTSGTYTPTLTNIVNLDGSTAYQWQYMRVGNVVTVSGQIDLDPTASAQNTSVRASLPIASNFTAATNCGGVFSSSQNLTQVGAVVANTSADEAVFTMWANSTSNLSHYFTFTYLIQ